MDTKIVRLNRAKIESEVIKMAGEMLLKGGLVAFPTETVYGLGANGLKESASARIYEAKGRPSDNPLIIHIACLEDLDRIVSEIPPKAKQLAEAFWPGPLTMIFDKSEEVPYGTTGGLETVAVRIPSEPIALALIRAGGGYIAAPSANTSGRPSPTLASHVIEDLNGRIDLVIDGGPVGIGLESTIVDMTTEIPMILRPGYINQRMLEEVIGPVDTDKALESDAADAGPKAPGMKYRHYAPRASLIVVEGALELVVAKINELSREKEAQNIQVGIIGTEETIDSYQYGIVRSIGTREREETIARHLYACLREFDESDVTVIYSESFETPIMGQAIMNRLLKAAGHQIIYV